ncbi:Gag-Pol polyprotein [Gossypium australe]|uniref:Gag-Pol polyprotein n=1 Tax=Gossypium australe TaxID=47621 RepID=A0A5B6UYH6_9ROSI|nr:Gag-Pol polyprotein [Gossypium australe]
MPQTRFRLRKWGRGVTPPVDKIRKYGAEDFRATADDDAERAEFWLENTIRVFDEMSLTSNECIKCAYISQRFIDQKRKEFLELKQGRMSVTEYEREFVRLSQYARECVSTEATMCKCFIEGLNEDIKLLVRILDLNEFVVLVERACKAVELSKEKKKVDSKARDERKRLISKSSQSTMKRFRDASNRLNVSFGHPSRDRPRQSVGPKAQFPSESSVGSLVSSKTLPVESTEFVIRVSNPLGKCVLVDKVCKNCPLMFQDICFPANLMLLPFDEFDIILGMDWLTLHHAIVNCKRKSIDLRTVASTMKALNYVKKGCEAYLAYVIDTKVLEKKVESILVVCKFPDVFLEELPGLPPIREVKFGVELVLGRLLS